MHYIEIRTSFTGFHRWIDAPDQVEFLRAWHRHTFNVEVTFKVDHNNRNREFFITKAEIDKYINDLYADRYFEYSCEFIAEDIANKFKALKVLVREDNESAGIFIYE